MGSNLALNAADKGYTAAGYDVNASKVDSLVKQAHTNIFSTHDAKEFVKSLKKPRAVLIMVPAGKAVDDVIGGLLDHIEEGDIIIDGGNSHFTDTDVRMHFLKSKGIYFLGMGISGGEYGARHGPSMMPGGPRAAYERVRPIFESMAAKAGDSSPCVRYMGSGSAGHYVKMVHNGIEYGIMRLVAETYDLMKRGLGIDDPGLSEIYGRWNKGELNSYLIEITEQIFITKDEQTGKYLIDVISDAAKQKGTGMWTSESGMGLHVPIPTIDIAVSMRDLSCYKILRHEESMLCTGPDQNYGGNKDELITKLADALYASMMLTYVQGFALLYRASEVYDYGISLEDVCAVWRGGCIIRSAIIERLYEIMRGRDNIEHLLTVPGIAELINLRQDPLREIVKTFADLGLSGPGFMSAISYFDSIRSDWLPANLIQAQRDYFGSHQYERIDSRGTFHTTWQRQYAESR
jgi:6-phosphogluconate dehydrogenase